MKPQLIDEVVFENRNKNYGAYLLRKRYFRSLYLSFILAFVFFALAVLISVVANTSIDDEFYDFTNVVFEYSDLQYVPDERPKAPENPKPPEKEAAPAKTEDLNKVKVVNDTVPEIDSTLTEDIKDAKGDSLNGTAAQGNGSDTGIVFTRVQEIPMYPGGEDARKKFIKENFDYAGLGTNVKIEGVVWITFIVEKDGSLTEIKVANGIGAMCDNAVIKVVKQMPKWIPGKQNGKPVRVILKMPVRFEKEA